jgi:Pyridoxamine 5'-phosphate oxidase
MAAWDEFERAAPDLAVAIAARFAAHKHALLATLRRDGSPRLSGIETSFRNGELWLAMMPDSRKADDLRHDPRFALHSAPVDLDLADGDAKVNGRAVPVVEQDDLDAFVAGLDQELPPSGLGLFRADVSDASLTRVADDWLVIESWRDGGGVRTVRRQ